MVNLVITYILVDGDRDRYHLEGLMESPAVDDDGETVLHIAIAKKFTDCAIVILENGGCKSMGFLNSKRLT